MHTPTHTTTLKIRMCRHTGTTTLNNGRSQSMRMARAAAMPQRHGNVGERGKGEKGGKRLTACAEKGTKCDCSSIVPLLVSRQNTAFRVATVLPCRSKGGAGCICGAQRISRRLGAEVQRCFHGHTTPPR